MIYCKEFQLHGINFKSRKSPDVKRQQLIERIIPGDVLDLEEYKYKGEPALMVIDPKTNLDIGVVPAEDVDRFLPYLDKPFYVNVLECYDLDDDRCGLYLELRVLSDEEFEQAQRQLEEIKAEKEAKKRARKETPIYKRWWFIVIVIFFIAFILDQISKMG